MRFHAAVCAIALALAGCATAPDRSESFSGSTEQAYVLAGVPLSEYETHTLTFQRVDLATSTFQPQMLYFRVGPDSGEVWKRVPKDRDEAASMRFGGRRFPPGEYALVEHSVTRNAGHGTIIDVNCYSAGAAIYRLQDRAINLMFIPRFIPGWLQKSIVTIGTPVRDTAALQARAEQFLAGYPNMTAPRVVIDPIGAARFETEKKKCTVPQAFSFTAL